jgi:hypothetical protein
MSDEDGRRLDQLIRELALTGRQIQNGQIQTLPPVVPPRVLARQSSWENNGDLGLPPVVNVGRRENYNKIVLNKRMWVSLLDERTLKEEDEEEEEDEEQDEIMVASPAVVR